MLPFLGPGRLGHEVYQMTKHYITKDSNLQFT
jgi:hypothetical protein